MACDAQIPQAWFSCLLDSDKHHVINRLSQINTAIHQQMDADVIICPPEAKRFAALEMCAPEQVKVIIIGQDPYHGERQANGLAFSVHPGVRVPPSLRNIFKELHDDLELPLPTQGNLEPWAHQGVLLLNASLSVKSGCANSHKNLGWRAVTEAILRCALVQKQPKVVCCWGNFANEMCNDALKTLNARRSDVRAEERGDAMVVGTAAPGGLGAPAKNASSLSTDALNVDAPMDALSRKQSACELWNVACSQPANSTPVQETHVLVLRAKHPSPLAARHSASDTYQPFRGSRPFSQANAFLQEHGCTPIQWRLP